MRERRRRWPAARWLTGLSFAALMLLASVVQAATPTSSLRIGVATMQPGDFFWERFGHDTLVVDDPGQDFPVSYNFGSFDPTEPGFLGRFVRGEMEYQLVAMPFAYDLSFYSDSGRGVSIQWLDLSEAEAMELAAALEENAKPENARYRYDYFTDNCATRVRNAIDNVLGGTLKRQMEGRSQGNTYRTEAVRLASPAWWMWLGFDLGLGPYADQPRNRWEDAFVPMHLADSLREARRADGRPVVASEEQLLPHRIAPEPRPAARRWWPWLLAGLVIASLALGASRKDPIRGLWVGVPFWSLCVVLGGLMLFLWVFTAHRAGWANHNLLLFNPACLLLLPGAIRLLRGRPAGRLFHVALPIVTVAAVIALFLLWLPLQPQRNAPWIALLLPIHVALWWRLRLAPRAAAAQHRDA